MIEMTRVMTCATSAARVLIICVRNNYRRKPIRVAASSAFLRQKEMPPPPVHREGDDRWMVPDVIPLSLSVTPIDCNPHPIDSADYALTCTARFSRCEDTRKGKGALRSRDRLHDFRSISDDE